MRRFNVEIAVGIFVLAGILCLAYLSIKLSKMEMIGGGYQIEAVFSNSGGLKDGAPVVISGVEVGRVKSIGLDSDYQAKVVMVLPEKIKIQEDAIASIKTKGLIGEKYVEIIPGASDIVLKAGDRIRDTQPAVDLEQLISSFVFGKL